DLLGPKFSEPLKLAASDRVAAEFSLFRDYSCLEIFRALAAGACLINLPGEAALPPRKLAALLRNQGATVVQLSAGTVARLVRDFPWAFKAVRLILYEGLFL